MEEHYLGEDVTLRFDALVDGKPKKPLNASAAIYNAKGDFMSWGKVTVTKEEVSCKVAHDELTRTGEYVAVFDVRLPYLGKKEHVMHFKVVRLPVSSSIAREVKNANSLGK